MHDGTGATDARKVRPVIEHDHVRHVPLDESAEELLLAANVGQRGREGLALAVSLDSPRPVVASAHGTRRMQAARGDEPAGGKDGREPRHLFVQHVIVGVERQAMPAELVLDPR